MMGLVPHQHACLVGGFRYFLFSSLLGEISHFGSYFSKGLKPQTRCDMLLWFSQQFLVCQGLCPQA